MILRLFVSCILILTGLHTSVLYKMSIWLRVSEHISFKLVVMSYRSIHGTSPSYLQSCFTRVSDMTSIRRLWSLPHIVWMFRRFVSLQSAGGRFRFQVPPSGTTCLSTSHMRRHSRFSDNDSRPFCFPVPTKTLSYDSCVTITIHLYCLHGHLWSLQ